MENYFSKKLINKSDSEVQNYIDNKEHFQEEAVQAAIWELERRGKQSEQSEKVQEELKEKKQICIEEKVNSLGIPVGTVSPGIRFVHFIIDGFIIQAFTYFINVIPNVEISQVLSFIMYPLYYIFFEYYYQWTPGKLISDTIVVDKHGEKPNLKIIILRTFTRLIPFEPFSCLDSNSWGWHDRWTKTYVIQKDDLAILRESSRLKNSDFAPRRLDKSGYIIIAIFLATIVGSVFLSKFTADRLTQVSFKWVKELDEKDYNNILGTWNTNDSRLGKLNFISNDVVISNGNKNLNYKIENRVLTISDNDRLERNFVIIESSSTVVKLIDIDNSRVELVWRK